MSNLARQSDWTVCADFGHKPVGLAAIHADPMVVLFGGIIGGLAAQALLGAPGLAFVAFVTIQDAVYCRRSEEGIPDAPRTAENPRMVVDELDAPIVRSVAPTQTAPVVVVAPLTLAQLGNALFARVPEEYRFDLTELNKSQGAIATLCAIVQILGLTDAQLEQQYPGATALLTAAPPKVVPPTIVKANPVAAPAAPAAPVVAPTMLRRQSDDALPHDRDSLLARLKTDCPALVNLLKAPPIRLVGVQRSGKTTLAKIIALLRLVILPDHQVIASTPHAESENSYPDVFTVVGVKDGKRDFAATNRQWAAMHNRIFTNTRSPGNTTIWDEFGLLDAAIDPDDILSVVKTTLREATKHGEYPMFIVHGETLNFLPGVTGIREPFLKSTMRVEAIGAMVEGDDGIPYVQPTGRFTVTNMDGTSSNGILPNWLTEAFLLTLLSPAAVAVPKKPVTVTPAATPGVKISVAPTVVAAAPEDPWEAADTRTPEVKSSPMDTLAKLAAAGVTLDDLQALLTTIGNNA
jgi:hypothetical protein